MPRLRVELVASYYANVLALLHAHHEAEDVTISRKMLERLPEHVDVISRVNAEHEGVLDTLGACRSGAPAWRADPSGTSRNGSGGPRSKLCRPSLIEHLDHEEADVVPLIGQCINVAEWGQMSATAFQLFSGDKVWLVIGLIQEQMLPAGERDDGGEHATAGARVLGGLGAGHVPGLRRRAARLRHELRPNQLAMRRSGQLTGGVADQPQKCPNSAMGEGRVSP